MRETAIKSVAHYFEAVKAVYSNWGVVPFPWFRGQTVDAPLLPRLFRSKINETNLIQLFRLKARSFPGTPHRDNIDEWLFLMQHHGLPTRLLDWTESALVALFFAVYNADTVTSTPVVWMLNPLELNRVSVGIPEFPLSWTDTGILNFRTAFEKGAVGHELPVAIYPASIDIRVSAQKSCFTIHGKNTTSIDDVFRESLMKRSYLLKYPIIPTKKDEILSDLRIMGISYSTLFPDFDGLSEELRFVFSKKPK